MEFRLTIFNTFSMQRVLNFGSRLRTIADLIFLSVLLIFIQYYYAIDENHFFSSTTFGIISTCLLCWYLTARSLGLYIDYREKPLSAEWVAFFKTFIIYSLVVSFIFFLFIKEHFYIRRILYVHCSILFVLFPIQKLCIRLALKKLLNSNRVVKRVLIVGAQEIGMGFYNRFIKNEHYGYKLAGFIDDKANQQLNGHYLGKTSDIENVITKYEFDEIIWTLPMTDGRQFKNVMAVGEKAGKRIRIIQDYQVLGISNLHVDKLGNLTIISIRSLPLDNSDNKVMKRLFDILFSSLVIVLILSWLLPIISLLVKISSRGPVFFKQERWGLNNKPIICYKFRTMVADSRDVDENGNYLQACKNDQRVTRIGRFLRKTNLDELPQFFNVLLGSMSVSGPRPHPVPLNLKSKDSIENYLMRHWVKPGITGWAQTQGLRGETLHPYRMQERVKADLWYIENWTLWLDLQIILQTLVNIVKGQENAY